MNRGYLLLTTVVVTIGLAGCTTSPVEFDDRAEFNAISNQVSANGTGTPGPTPAAYPTDAPDETSSDASGGGGDDDGTAGGSEAQASSGPTSTFKVMATTDDEIRYRFTVDGGVSKTVADDGTAADDEDRIVEHDDGTTTVVGSTGEMAGDAYLVDGQITAFERTGGESLYRLFLDGDEVTEELTPGSTFEIVSTDDDAEFAYEFTADGEVQRMVSESDHAGDRSDEIVEHDDGTTTVVGSTGFGSGDAFAVTGEVTSFERTDGDSSFRLYLDGDDVTDELGSPDDEEDVYGDSTYDVSHTRSIESNADGTTTVSGEVWNRNDGTLDDLVIVVEVYDDAGDWLDSGWVELDPMTRERQAYSIVVDVPRDEIADFRTDVNQNTQAGPGNYPGRCHEIDGDGPDDQKLETGPAEVIQTDGRTFVVAEVYNGKGRTVGLAHATFALYDGADNRVGTETVILEDLGEGEQREFAVALSRFSGDDIADDVVTAHADVDEIALNYHNELVCRPPL